MRSLLLTTILLLSSEAQAGGKCGVPTCTYTLTDQLPFTPPEPGIWLMYEQSGDCGTHWMGEWTVTDSLEQTPVFYVYRRPWNAQCGPSCAEPGNVGQYIHIPTSNPAGVYKVEVKSPKGGGWDAECGAIK